MSQLGLNLHLQGTQSSIATTSTSTSASLPTNTLPSDQAGNGGLSTGAKAGIGVGAAVGVILLIGLGFIYGKRSAVKKAKTGDVGESGMGGKAELGATEAVVR